MADVKAREVIAIAIDGEPVSIMADIAADAILDALSAAGFAVVPVEPTEAMLKAGDAASYGSTNCESVWSAMLAAAKEAPDA